MKVILTFLTKRIFLWRNRRDQDTWVLQLTLSLFDEAEKEADLNRQEPDLEQAVKAYTRHKKYDGQRKDALKTSGMIWKGLFWKHSLAGWTIADASHLWVINCGRRWTMPIITGRNSWTIWKMGTAPAIIRSVKMPSVQNWLFSGTPRRAEASAGYYTLMETAKANGVKPERYQMYLLSNIPGMDFSNHPEYFDDMMPWDDEVKKLCTWFWKMERIVNLLLIVQVS